MKNESNYLSAYSEGPAKHYGEVGIIREILRILNISDEKKWCVEFGAGNGVSASNSKFFIEEFGYSALLIEPMKSRFSKLEKLHQKNNSVYTVCRFVDFTGKNSLDEILNEFKVPKEFAFVSIDIDGNDYHIWDSLVAYRPILVCIEINETVPPDVKFVQEKSFKVNQGCGIRSMTELAKSKGYELVCVSENNAFYVVRECFDIFNIENNSPLVMCHDQSSYTRIFFGYDGTIFLRGEGKLRWHSTFLDKNKLQILPKILRKFPPTYTTTERFFFRLWRFFYSPIRFLEDVYRKFFKRKT